MPYGKKQKSGAYCAAVGNMKVAAIGSVGSEIKPQADAGDEDALDRVSNLLNEVKTLLAQ